MNRENVLKNCEDSIKVEQTSPTKCLCWIEERKKGKKSYSTKYWQRIPQILTSYSPHMGNSIIYKKENYREIHRLTAVKGLKAKGEDWIASSERKRWFITHKGIPTRSADNLSKNEHKSVDNIFKVLKTLIINSISIIKTVKYEGEKDIPIWIKTDSIFL